MKKIQSMIKEKYFNVWTTLDVQEMLMYVGVYIWKSSSR